LFCGETVEETGVRLWWQGKSVERAEVTQGIWVTPEELFAFTLYYYNIGCVCYLLFCFCDLFGDRPLADLYQLKIKPVISFSKSA
jgi:hypothetical protein